MTERHAARLERVRSAMSDSSIDVLLLSVGPDLPYLTGYEAMPLERLTMLVVPCDEEATLVVPRLEGPRVVQHPEVFSLLLWDETDDPVDIVTRLAGSPAVAAVGDQTWSRFLVELVQRLPATSFVRASDVLAPLRAVKEPDEVAALRTAARAADRVAAQLQTGSIPLLGRTEASVSDDIGRRLLAEGHQRVNFAIVASGANAASPHHDPGPKVIEPGEVVLCDFGGTMADADGVGYCSDITRCVFVGEPTPEFRDLYAVLEQAQAEAVASATVGTSCADIDAAARRIITGAGYGEYFIHRTGHGIGVEAHEDPYIVATNDELLVPGHAFSIEPGIYVPGRWGARLEDIVVATDAGPDPLNTADHGLALVEV